MAVTCGVGYVMYLLPMLLGRTYDMQTSTVGIDIYNQDDVDQAMKNAVNKTSMQSYYKTIEGMSEKRDFLGISGEMALKISAGLFSAKGSYLKDTSNFEKSVEILIKTTFITREAILEADHLKFWETLPKESVGTHAVTSLLFGGELIASVNFIAHKEEYLQDIKGQVNAALSKGGAFDGKAQGNLEMLAKNISTKAKMEINYYATVPLDQVPHTIEGLKILVSSLRDQVQKMNNGTGVAICARLRPLSDFNDKFSFNQNEILISSLDDFSALFDDLRQAKSLMKSLVSSLSLNVSKDYFEQVANFSARLTNTLMTFHNVIGNLDLEKGRSQLEPARKAYEANSGSRGNNRYTVEIRKLIEKKEEKDDPEKPRVVYTRWGKRSCEPKTGKILYIGFMCSFTEKGIGSGTQYQCLPENPDLHLDFNATGSTGGESKLAAVRYTSLSVFTNQAKDVENKVASCTVCESMRTTVEMFPSAIQCPEDWTEEYSGFVVTSSRTRGRAEFVCLDNDPDSYGFSPNSDRFQPVILPVKIGEKDSSLPCVVCSK